MYFENVVFALIETVPLMLIGMGLYRMGLFERRMDRAKMRRWGWIGLIGGADPDTAVRSRGGGADFLTMMTQGGAGRADRASPPADGPRARGATCRCRAPSAAPTWPGRRFTAAGRMAFSNYIGTSLVMALFFQGWAGGPVWAASPIRTARALWRWDGHSMLACSPWWLGCGSTMARSRWLWRCLIVLARVLPLRRSVRV